MSSLFSMPVTLVNGIYFVSKARNLQHAARAISHQLTWAGSNLSLKLSSWSSVFLSKKTAKVPQIIYHSVIMTTKKSLIIPALKLMLIVYFMIINSLIRNLKIQNYGTFCVMNWMADSLTKDITSFKFMKKAILFDGHQRHESFHASRLWTLRCLYGSLYIFCNR